MCFELDSLPPILPIAGAAVDSEDLELEASDGTKFAAFEARAEEPLGPAVLVLPPVRSLRGRLRGIRQARPGLPPIDQLNAVAWPLRVRGLERLGALDVVRERLAAEDAFDALRELDEALDLLDGYERQEERRAITGEGYRTLWPVVRQA